jgi:hypothetical protein
LYRLAAYLQAPILLGGQITHQARCWLDEAITRIERELQTQLTLRADYCFLRSIPGVGPALGSTIALETGTIQRFASPGHYSSYARCVKSEKICNDKPKGQGNKEATVYAATAIVEAASTSSSVLSDSLAISQAPFAHLNEIGVTIRLLENSCYSTRFQFDAFFLCRFGNSKRSLFLVECANFWEFEQLLGIGLGSAHASPQLGEASANQSDG